MPHLSVAQPVGLDQATRVGGVQQAKGVKAVVLQSEAMAGMCGRFEQGRLQSALRLLQVVRHMSPKPLEELRDR